MDVEVRVDPWLRQRSTVCPSPTRSSASHGEVGGRLGDHAGRPVQQGLPRRPGTRRRPRGRGQPGPDLGPAELRRVGRLLHWRRRSPRCRPTRSPRCSRHLDMAPAVISGGSGGSRVSMLTAARHPEVAVGTRVVVDQRRRVRAHEPGPALLRAVAREGLARRAWRPSSSSRSGRRCSSATRRTGNASSTRTAGSSSRRWNGGCWPTARAATNWFPGSPSEAARALDVPALVFRSGESDAYHTRATSEQVAALLPNARLVGAAVGRPRVDRTRGSARDAGGSLFDRWYLLVPQLTEWSGGVFS